MKLRFLFAVLIALPSLCFGQGSTEAVISLSDGLHIGSSATDRIGFGAATPVARSVNSKTSRQVLEDHGLVATGGTDTTVENAMSTSADNTLSDGVDFVLDSTNGTKIGTATSQKLGFLNATPVIQQGATIDLGVVLSNFGLRAAGTAYTITTSGNTSFTGTINLGGDVTIAAGKDITYGVGDGKFDGALGTGIFTTTTGTNTFSGTGVIAANKSWSVGAGTTAMDFSGGTGVFKTTTGLVTIGGKMAQKAIAGTPVAAAGAGGGVAGAQAIGSANIVLVSSDGATKGVKLLTGVAGDIVYVINTSGTACNIFAASGGTLNGGSADVGLTIPASKGVLCICTSADTWFVFDFTAHAGAAS